MYSFLKLKSVLWKKSYRIAEKKTNENWNKIWGKMNALSIFIWADIEYKMCRVEDQNCNIRSGRKNSWQQYIS